MDRLKKQWDELSKNEAYYAVLSEQKFRSHNLDDSALEDFFQTGEEHVSELWEDIETHFVKDFRPRRALDFGCGVGRLVIPLSARSDEVVGVDISGRMLDESRRNCESRGIQNTRFFLTNEFLAAENEVDLVHSFIVFQHIKPKIGEQLLRKLLSGLSIGGIGAIHFTYSDPSPPFQKLRTTLYRDIPFLHSLKEVLTGGPTDPLIRMYRYDLKRVFEILRENNCGNCLVRSTDHTMKGVFLIFQKAPDLRDRF